MTAQEFAEEGWHPIDFGRLPPPDMTVEFGRDERVHRQAPWFGKLKDLNPDFNVAGLWWREP